jgi:hypothetical protein
VARLTDARIHDLATVVQANIDRMVARGWPRERAERAQLLMARGTNTAVARHLASAMGVPMQRS